MHILWLTPYTPWPLDSGGRIRIYNLARGLSRLGHTIDMLVIGDRRPELPDVLPDGVSIEVLLGRRSHTVPGRVRSLVSHLPLSAWTVLVDSLRDRPAYDVAVLEQSTMGAYASILDELNIPWILDAQNIEAFVYTQLRRRARRVRTRALLALDGPKMQRLESMLFRAARTVVAMSAADAERIMRTCGDARVVVHPNGVDSEYFAWTDHSVPVRSNIVLTASFSYGPNADAARWIVDELMPAIGQRIPGVRATLVGRDPPQDILTSSRDDPSIDVTGTVSDVRPYLRNADIFLAPLRAGSGTRLKALEALASGLPIVATSLAIEGLGLEDSGLVLVADTVDGLVSAVDRGLHDLALRRRMVFEGRDYVVREFSWVGIARGFAATLAEAAQRDEGT